jgi:transposase-like protein
MEILQMASKSLAVVEDDDEVEAEAPAKTTTKVAATVVDDDGNTLNTYGGEVNTVKVTAAKAEHKKLVNAVTAANEYEEQGEEVYQEFFDALEASYIDNIHIHFGFSSWTEYVNEHVHLTIPSAEIRKRAVASLSEKGVSQRAIAKALTVSQSTVSRDQEEADTTDSGESVKTTGLDGREVTRRGKAKPKETDEDSDDDVIDAEVIELPKANDKRPLSKRFADVVGSAAAVGHSLGSLLAEVEKATAANKKKLVAAHAEDILAVTNSLLDLCEKLGIEVYEEDETAAEPDEDEPDEDETETEDEDEGDEEPDEDDAAEAEADDEDEPF